MAIVEVKVPQLSESVAEATMLQWKKKAGDYVAVDEILIEIETDKVVLECPAPSSGVLVEILLSAMFAPVMMLAQSQMVREILTGSDSGWKPQRRNDGSIAFLAAINMHKWHMLLGFSAAIATCLAQEMGLNEAVASAKEFVSRAIAQHFMWQSAGAGPVHALNHLQQTDA